jgi:hypothetical protein
LIRAMRKEEQEEEHEVYLWRAMIDSAWDPRYTFFSDCLTEQNASESLFAEGMGIWNLYFFGPLSYFLPTE